MRNLTNKTSSHSKCTSKLENIVRMFRPSTSSAISHLWDTGHLWIVEQLPTEGPVGQPDSGRISSPTFLLLKLAIFPFSPTSHHCCFSDVPASCLPETPTPNKCSFSPFHPQHRAMLLQSLDGTALLARTVLL